MASNTAAIDRTLTDVGPVEVSGRAAAQAPSRAPRQTEAVSSPQDAVQMDVIPSTPPPEVMDAIATAGAAYEQLQSSGRHIHFGLDESGRVQIELQDLKGQPISGLTPNAVLRAAEGGRID
jgi:hypothetical protein